MIVSHEHKFIFCRTRKTASSSLQTALAGLCGPRDIIGDDIDRTVAGGDRSARKYVPLMRYNSRELARLVVRGERRRYTPHSAARAVRRWVGGRTWNAYFKFAVERNPFDRAVSLYFWRTREEAVRPAMDEFLRTVEKWALSNWHIYAIGDGVALDYVARYEALDAGLRVISSELGFRETLELPQIKVGVRPGSADYREMLSDDDVAVIRRLCRREIEHFDYCF